MYINKIEGIDWFQSLFYWITYSYGLNFDLKGKEVDSFNPYFIGLPILIIIQEYFLCIK